MSHPFSQPARSPSVVRNASKKLAGPSTGVEALEARRLLSGHSATINLAAQPVYHPTNTDLTDTKNGPLAIAGQALSNLYADYRRAVKNGTDFSPSNGQAQALVMADNTHVYVNVGTRGKFDTFVKRMKAAGMVIASADASLGVVEGVLPIDAIYSVATRSDVALLQPIDTPITHRAGRSGNQGDRVMNTDDIRSSYPNVTGAGVTVGVLSNSFDAVGSSTSSNTGDLPRDVNVLNDDHDPSLDENNERINDDEGRAMLEEIHDIAPGAKLAFSTAHGGQLAMADHIRALQSKAGANVITDDVTYLSEPFFGPGVIDKAISDVVANGASYTSSAGNNSDSGFQQNAQYATVNNRRFVDFNPSGGVATRMLIKVDKNGELTLQWDNPYNGVTGRATSDMDIRLYEPGTNTIATDDVGRDLVGLDSNLATGLPIEQIGVPAGSYDLEIELHRVLGTNPAPSVYRVQGNAGLSYTKYVGITNNVIGHNASPYGISVAAVDYTQAPPYASGEIPNEPFSSLGPTTQIFDLDGNRLAKPVTLQKPDISGVDGVNTSFFPDYHNDDDFDEGEDTDGDGLPNFFGTSAAAPNIAAGIALIKSVAPGATQANILAQLKATARPVNGTAKGKYDPKGGYGLADFNAALPLAIGTLKATIYAPDPSPRQDPVDSIKIKFSQRVTGLDAGDFSLQRNGGPELLTAPNLLTTKDNYIFTLTNLTDITTRDGTYTLTLNPRGSGIKNLLGQSLTRNASTSFTIFTVGDPPARPIHFVAENVGATAVNLTWDDRSDDEDGFQILKSVNSDFTNSSLIKVGANVTQYLDQDLKPSEVYYYRIRSYNTFNGNLGYTAAVNATTGVSGDIVVDNSTRSTRTGGTWTAGTTGTGYLGSNYLTDGNTGKGTKTEKYIPSLIGDGMYYVYARWVRTGSNATNVPFDIYYGPKASLKTTVIVNERSRGGDGYAFIGGPYQMSAGSGAAVVIRTGGTNGTVVADSVRFLPAGPLTTSAYTKPIALSSFFSTGTIDSGSKKKVNEELI